MGKKYTFLACSLLCYVSVSFCKDAFKGPLSELREYSIIQPEIIHRNGRSLDKDEHTEPGDFISYLIEMNHKKQRLHLQRNREFLHPELFSDVNQRKIPVHCYYHGEVEGYTHSMVALSTCHGLRGIIVLEDETFGLEPLPESTSNEHALYSLSDVHAGASTCGVSDVGESEDFSQNETRFEPGHTLTSLLRKKRNLPTTSYVELALVVDYLRYIYKRQNETAVREEMVEVANLVDGYYKPLNIRVMLVHLEVFKDPTPFSVEGEPGAVLTNFVKWRKENLKARNDMAQLVVGRTGAYGSVLGMAFVGTVCSPTTSGGINVFVENMSLPYFSTIVAHEMGHNLGMNHDSEGCTCDGGCIMGAGGTSFSSCSAEDFKLLVSKGGGTCLRNVPSHSDVVGIAKCGNGLLEDGEQCDCGSPTECKDKCCEAATCRFTSGSECAAGRCCEDCRLKVAGSPCRASADTCDLPEFCTGRSAFCPDDFYRMDGLECHNGTSAYCYEGRCQTYDFQCQQIFAAHPKASKADDICFETANTQGDKFGNCGQKNNAYIKCPLADVMCGKVQCTNVDANHPPPGGTISNQIVNGSKCVNADFNLGTDVLDPAYSNPGSPCAPGKTCVDFSCVDAALLLPKLDCNARTTCHDRGVCNDQGHCHCEVGWGPPDCLRSGPGGSIDSGPASIDHSTRDGLLIFFFLVLPLLIMAVLLFLYLYRRDMLPDSCTRRRKSRSTTNGTSAPAQRNVNAAVHTSTQPPQPPVQRPVYPPPPGGFRMEPSAYKPETEAAAKPPDTGVAGWKYGELDYWKDQDQATAEPQSTVPPRPAPPRPTQAPGQRKTIPLSAELDYDV